MTKYYVEIALNKNKWIIAEVYDRHKDALEHVRANSGSERRYPMRVVRVVKTVVFEEHKNA